MKSLLFWGGSAAVVLGAGAPILLPGLPSSIQSNQALQPVGLFLIDYGGWIALFGVLAILIAVIFL